MMASGKNFAVLIPTANRSSFVCEAIERSLAQTLPPAEIIVVDDGSTDGTCSIVRERFPTQVRLVQQSKEGVQAARNKGAHTAKADWLALLDDDDLWDLDYLERANALLEQCDEIQGLFISFRVCEGERVILDNKFRSAPVSFWDIPGARHVGSDGVVARFPVERTFNYQPFFPSTTIVRRDVFHTIGAYNPTLRGVKGEDFEFTFRLLSCATCGFLMDTGATIRKHGANDSANSYQLTLGEYQVLEHIKHSYGRSLEPDVYKQLEIAISAKWHLALEAAFSLAKPELVRTLAKAFDGQLSLKERLKLSLSRLPRGLAPIVMQQVSTFGTLRSKMSANRDSLTQP